MLIVCLGLATINANKIVEPPYLFVCLAAVNFCFLGIWIASSSKPIETKSHFSNHYSEGETLEIKILEELKENRFNRKFIGRIERVDSLFTQGNVLLMIAKNDSSHAFEINDVLLTSEKLLAIRSPFNPGEFSFKNYMKNKGIAFQISLENDQWTPIRKGKGTLRSKAILIRGRIIDLIKKQGFSENQQVVIEALLLGEKRHLNKDLKRNYIDAGAMHILAISGLHIGILMMLINSILRPLRHMKYGRIIRVIIVAMLLWSFAFIAGLSSSVIRSVSMFSVLAIGIITDRKSSLDHYLFIAAFISVFMRPLIVFDLGFQLSYMAVLSILYAGPKIKNLWHPQGKILRYFWNIIAVSMAAQLGILPISLYYFHHFSGVFLITSILVIPILGILLGGGYLMIVLILLNCLPTIYVKIYSFFIEVMNQVIGLIGEMDLFIYRHIFFDLILLVLVYVALYTVLRCISALSFWRISALALCFSFISIYVLYQDKEFRSSSEFVVFHLYRNSLFLIKKGQRQEVYYSKDDKKTSYCLVNYNRQFVRKQEAEHRKVKHFFRITGRRVMMIDQDIIDTDLGFAPDIIVLMNSPKINLLRFVEKVKPSLIVADGSNYPGIKSLWKKTCEENGISFHDTAVDGALILSKEA